MGIWTPSANPNVDDQLMEDWLVAVLKTKTRGIKPQQLRTTMEEFVSHLSAGRLEVSEANSKQDN